jgi:hypothetical protein
MRWAVYQALSSGQRLRPGQIRDHVALYFELTPAERAELDPQADRNKSRFVANHAAALAEAAKRGEIRGNPALGYVITQAGLEYLSTVGPPSPATRDAGPRTHRDSGDEVRRNLQELIGRNSSQTTVELGSEPLTATATPAAGAIAPQGSRDAAPASDCAAGPAVSPVISPPLAAQSSERVAEAGDTELSGSASSIGSPTARADRQPSPGTEAVGGEPRAMDPEYAPRELARRGFDADRLPTPGQLRAERLDRVETFARQERARIEHQRLVQRLHAWLTAAGWSELAEDRAVDLWGTSPDGARVIFEAKTISENALSQCRAGLAQLLEYRVLYGSADDDLCLVTNAPLTQTRIEIFDELGIAVLIIDRAVRAANEHAVALADVTIERLTG